MISGGYRCPLYDDDAAVTTTDLGSDQATHQLDSARTGAPSRFASEAAYANHTGTSPVQIASAETNRHRLSRYGDQRLNSGSTQWP